MKRDVDLVIKNEKDMDKLLSFIVYKLRTVDGIKNSAIPFENFLVKRYIKQTNVDFSRSEAQKIIRHGLMRKTLLKYKLFRIRNKISFHSFVLRMTPVELILSKILENHDNLVL